MNHEPTHPSWTAPEDVPAPVLKEALADVYAAAQPTDSPVPTLEELFLSAQDRRRANAARPPDLHASLPVRRSWWERWVEPPLLRWLTSWHGRGVPEQEGYYRCVGCRRIVTWNAIRKGGCTCGTSRRLTTTHLRWWEKVRLICLPWWVVR